LVLVAKVECLDLTPHMKKDILVQTLQHSVYKLMVEVAAQTDNRLGEIHLDLLVDQVVVAAVMHQMLLVLVEHMVMMVELELQQVPHLVEVVVVPVRQEILTDREQVVMDQLMFMRLVLELLLHMPVEVVVDKTIQENQLDF
tara:strand:- start:111 stop:536 length:426 start_codon:yes stop_codon:yes gene_type:complete